MICSNFANYQFFVLLSRENACEVLFERDADEMSVATLVLDSILKVEFRTTQQRKLNKRDGETSVN